MTCTKNTDQPKFADGYAQNGVGGMNLRLSVRSKPDWILPGLIHALLSVDSLGNFGNFCLIVLALSIIANNCPWVLHTLLFISEQMECWHRRLQQYILYLSQYPSAREAVTTSTTFCMDCLSNLRLRRNRDSRSVPFWGCDWGESIHPSFFAEVILITKYRTSCC